jgi:ribosomal protein L13E
MLSPIDALKAKLRQEDMITNIYGIGQLRQAGYSDMEICNLHFPAKLLWAYNFDCHLLRKQSYPPKDLLTAGFSLRELYQAGYSIHELFSNGVEISKLLQLGISIAKLRCAGIPDEKILTNKDISLMDIKELESEPRKLFNLGFTLAELVQARFTVAELRGAGKQSFTIMQCFI